MNWKKGVWFALLLWIIMFVVASIFVAFGVSSGAWMSIIMLAIIAVLAFVFAGYVSPKTTGQAFSYGLLWAIVGIFLDYVISNKFVPDMFASTYYWVSYLLVVLVPFLAIKKTPAIANPQ